MKSNIKKIVGILTIMIAFTFVRCTCTGSEPKTAAEVQQEQNDSIASAREKKIDYALSQLKDMVKKEMKDPSSFEMVDRAWDKKDTTDVVKLVLKYRGNNSFGAKVTSTTFGVYDMKNETVRITETQ